LGLKVRQTPDGIEADLDLAARPLVNPLANRALSVITFTVVGDRLIIVAPRELVGTPPFHLPRIDGAQDLEQQVRSALSEHIFHLQHRSSALQAIGLNPEIDPESLQLTAEVSSGPYSFTITCDTRGNFRLAKARRNGEEIALSGIRGFEISEFRVREALAGYLSALVGERSALASEPAASGTEDPRLTFGQMTRSFGEGAMLAPLSTLEVAVLLRVNGESYRFTAARVAGQTFRGLLASSSGKIWAERFSLKDFPGVTSLVARLLSVSAEAVQIDPGEEH
jgi:hypothetical protein